MNEKALSAMMKVMREIEHGSLASKRMRCRKLWASGVSITELGRMFNASPRTIYHWLMPIRWRKRMARDARIKDLWARGMSVRDIATREGLSIRRTYEIIREPLKRKRFSCFW